MNKNEINLVSQQQRMRGSFTKVHPPAQTPSYLTNDEFVLVNFTWAVNPQNNWRPFFFSVINYRNIFVWAIQSFRECSIVLSKHTCCSPLLRLVQLNLIFHGASVLQSWCCQLLSSLRISFYLSCLSVIVWCCLCSWVTLIPGRHYLAP